MLEFVRAANIKRLTELLVSAADETQRKRLRRLLGEEMAKTTVCDVSMGGCAKAMMLFWPSRLTVRRDRMERS